MKHLLASNSAPLPPLLLLIILLLQLNPTTFTRAEGEDVVFLYCPDSGNYTSGSQYESNLVYDLLPSLVANGPRKGYLTDSRGENPSDTVYGLVQCRDDVSIEECQACLNVSSVEIIKKCPNKRAATRRNDNCLLRYTTFNFFSIVNDYKKEVYNPVLVEDPQILIMRLGILMKNLISTAKLKPSKFATGSTEYNALSDIYGLVQCTRDLSSSSCAGSLQDMISYIPFCCDGMRGVRIMGLNCYVRFEIYNFLESSLPPPSPSPSLPPPSPPSPIEMSPESIAGTRVNDGKSTKSSSSPNVVVIAVISILAALVLLLVALLCVYLARRKTRRRGEIPIEAATAAGKTIKSEDSLQFDLVTLANATNNFSDTNKLGEGGFAVVYKGELLDGEEIAVKRLANNSVQGPQQFKNEVALLHKLQHRNLVRLLGYCLEGEETILIYEFVPNRSLDKYLFDPLKRVSLDWGTRYKIIRGIARGLLYLHEDSRLRIIHRDLKAGNILLDGEMNAKIADFGTAKLFGVDQTTGNTSRIAGTFGYMAPEYALHGLFSVKSDVFSFGVLLLKIISGQKINSFPRSTPRADLLSYAWKHWSEGTSIELIDPGLKDNYSTNEVTRSIHVALLCVQEDIEDRPTMSSVVNMLDNSFALASPAQPTFFTSKRSDPNAGKKEAESHDPTTNSSISFSSKELSTLASALLPSLLISIIFIQIPTMLLEIVNPENVTDDPVSLNKYLGRVP